MTRVLVSWCTRVALQEPASPLTSRSALLGSRLSLVALPRQRTQSPSPSPKLSPGKVPGALPPWPGGECSAMGTCSGNPKSSQPAPRQVGPSVLPYSNRGWEESETALAPDEDFP